MRGIMDKIKVLLVDDHAIMRDGIRALLSIDSNIEIVGEAGEGKEAVEKAAALSPDVIVMDIAMPGMDGLEATRRIMKQNPKARILILSQHDDREYVLSSIKAGSAGYLPKRALGSELVSAIKAVYKGESFLHPSAASALIKDYREQSHGTDAYDQLTPREREILKLIAEGHTSKEIAGMLFISLKTVMGHRAKMMEKLSLRNRTDLIKYAMKKGLLSIDS
jgi:DNA-binding NarL/FixJ family response regulator